MCSGKQVDTGVGMRCHKFISLFGGVAAAATKGTTKSPTATSTQIEVARVKPVDTMSPDLRLSDNLIDLMKDFSLSSAQGYWWCLEGSTSRINALRRALRAMVKSH
jgi:hypothetical protein